MRIYAAQSYFVQNSHSNISVEASAEDSCSFYQAQNWSFNNYLAMSKDFITLKLLFEIFKLLKLYRYTIVLISGTLLCIFYKNKHF